MLAASVLAVLFGSFVPAAGEAPRAGLPERPVSMEIRSSALALLDANDDDVTFVEGGFESGLRGRLWLEVVPNKGEVAVAVTRCQRSQASRIWSRDKTQVTIGFRFAVAGAVAIGGERDTVEGEIIKSYSYEQSESHKVPSALDRRAAFGEAAEALSAKVVAWVLQRMPSLRPDGPDAGFQYKTKRNWLGMDEGLEVTQILRGSPAERAGLQIGDRIRQIDRVGGNADMNERVSSWRVEEAGTHVTLEVERGNQRRTIELTLAAPQRGRPRVPGAAGNGASPRTHDGLRLLAAAPRGQPCGQAGNRSRCSCAISRKAGEVSQ